MICRLLPFAVFLIVGCSPKVDQFEYIHVSEDINEPRGHCLGIRTTEIIDGYVPSPYRYKIPKLRFSAVIDSETKPLSTRIVGRFGPEVRITESQRKQIANCSGAEEDFGMLSFAATRPWNPSCSPSVGTDYLPVDPANGPTKIHCPRVQSSDCSLNVYRNHWKFNLILPRTAIREWRSVRAEFVDYVDTYFVDLGVCEATVW